MKNKGFTLVELLAVIAILALLVIIALPNVLSMFNRAKKDTFLTETKNIYKEISKKYITETMRGNKIKNISNSNNKLSIESSDLKYNIKLDNQGNVKKFQVSNGTYCISGKFNNLSELTTDKITEGECNIVIPKSFATDDWETIIAAVQDDDTEVYKIGDTKDIELDGYGKHTLRIANKSIPSECSVENFSQSACGFVLEFSDIVAQYRMNPAGTYNGKNYDKGYNKGGWPGSKIYKFINNNIYNSLPEDLKEGIIDTKVISGHGIEDTENFISYDKLYLLAASEIYNNWSNSEDTAKEFTRQLDYYNEKDVSTKNCSATKKGAGEYWWWTRSTYSTSERHFTSIHAGKGYYGDYAYSPYSVSPAFRIG